MRFLCRRHQSLLSRLWTKSVFERTRRHLQNKPYYVTTPIFYVNAEPHIGHLYTILVADATKRFQRMLTANEVLLSTGTDEHGLKVQRVAETSGIKPVELCDKTSIKFKELCDTFDVSNDDFMRTSEARHKLAVEAFWNKIYRNGYMYKDSYKGWYCPADEAFVTELNVTEATTENGVIKVSSESGNPVEWFEEENYVFALSSFRERLLKWLLNDAERVVPHMFYKELIHQLNQELRDISVSRPKSRVHWGIEVPDDESQTIYVWLDALVNYLTFAGYPNEMRCWPPDCQVVGKDILKFHAIYWPAFLMAADMELPRKILCHSHWLVDELKMSKSRGNVVNPFSAMTNCTSEGLRYYLLRQGVPDSDTDFSELQLTRFLNNELADTFGNLLNRCLSKSINKELIYPPTPNGNFLFDDSFAELIATVESLPEKCKQHFNSANFYLGIEAIMNCLRAANLFVDQEKPWQLAHQSDETDRLNAVIYCVFETLRVCTLLLQPIVPAISDKVLTKLNVPETERYWIHARPCFSEEHQRAKKHLNNEKLIVFQKLK